MTSGKKHDYDESKIKTLSSLEHIRLRTGMYIGRTGDGSHNDDGIYILLKEVVDNGIDEFIMGFGRRLDISIEQDRVAVRDYGRDWGLPHYWLERRSFDPDWLEQLQYLFAREAAKIADWGGQSFVGERVSLGCITGQPHYYLITWEKAARDTEADDARIAIRAEAWAKALAPTPGWLIGMGTSKA